MPPCFQVYLPPPATVNQCRHHRENSIIAPDTDWSPWRMPRDIPEIAFTHTISLRAYNVGWWPFRDFTIRPPIGLRRQPERLTETLRSLRDVLALPVSHRTVRKILDTSPIIALHLSAPNDRWSADFCCRPVHRRPSYAYPDCGR